MFRQNKNNIAKSYKIFRYVVVLLAISFIPSACLADRDTEDVFASVIVLPVFEIDIDNNYIDFGLVNPGESVTLNEGMYYNQIKCVSNKGIKYYLNIQILEDIIGPKGNKIPPSSFKWKVYDAMGSGVPVGGWQEFSDKPVLVYTSALEDETGNEVIIRFQYKLDLPASALGGHYILRVGYILTEEQ